MPTEKTQPFCPCSSALNWTGKGLRRDNNYQLEVKKASLPVHTILGTAGLVYLIPRYLLTNTVCIFVLTVTLVLSSFCIYGSHFFKHTSVIIRMYTIRWKSYIHSSCQTGLTKHTFASKEDCLKGLKHELHVSLTAILKSMAGEVF